MVKNNQKRQQHWRCFCFRWVMHALCYHFCFEFVLMCSIECVLKINSIRNSDYNWKRNSLWLKYIFSVRISTISTLALNSYLFTLVRNNLLVICLKISENIWELYVYIFDHLKSHTGTYSLVFKCYKHLVIGALLNKSLISTP